MSMIPEVKCRRCGETFSSLRSTCPNCGMRRVTQSGRTPGTTPGTVKGTGAYERAETNTKWQMIFGLILVVAVILAVIVMVTGSLDGLEGNSSVKVTTPPPTDAPATIEAPPTPPPTATPQVEKIIIRYFESEKDMDKNAPTMRVGDILTYNAVVYPATITGAQFTWSCDDESVVRLTPSEDTRECEIEVLETKAGGVVITAECFGVKGQFRLYLREAE